MSKTWFIHLNLDSNWTYIKDFLNLHPIIFIVWKFHPFHPRQILNLQEGWSYKRGTYMWDAVYYRRTLARRDQGTCSNRNKQEENPSQRPAAEVGSKALIIWDGISLNVYPSHQIFIYSCKLSPCLSPALKAANTKLIIFCESSFPLILCTFLSHFTRFQSLLSHFTQFWSPFPISLDFGPSFPKRPLFAVPLIDLHAPHSSNSRATYTY